MTESLLYMAIGFLAASLLTVGIVPLIHQRAVRLTMRQLENGLPLSMGEIQAEKDALRADFALSIRRLELSNEQLRARIGQLMMMVSQRDDQLRELRRRASEANVPGHNLPTQKRDSRTQRKRRAA